MPCDRPSMKKIYCGGREWGQYLRTLLRGFKLHDVFKSNIREKKAVLEKWLQEGFTVRVISKRPLFIFCLFYSTHTRLISLGTHLHQSRLAFSIMYFLKISFNVNCFIILLFICVCMCLYVHMWASVPICDCICRVQRLISVTLIVIFEFQFATL